MKTIKRSNESLQEISKFYESLGYGGGVKDNDDIFLTYLKEELICSVRLVEENSVIVLRGMFMLERFRGKGRGKDILNSLIPYLDQKEQDCYCIPKSNLEKFYGSIGFNKINLNESPPFLKDRLTEYLNKGFDVILMCRKVYFNNY
ncbi:GNAT family N-acetyltransferase [Bacteriovoracaceae bacterium]|nr:GNAT family N-acetyltransferase [Bacteriovoracaceae bacterium]